MYRRAPVLCFLLTSLGLCHGGISDVPGNSPPAGREGRLLFASVFPRVGPARHGSLAFTGKNPIEETQTTVFNNSLNARVKRLDPSVQCSDNTMSLKVKQARVPHFLVDNGDGVLIPVSQIPSRCGYLVRRSRRDLLFTAPYQGCYVSRRGGEYVLPLRLWGSTATMSCPAVSVPPSASCYPTGMVVKLGDVPETEVKVKACGSCRFAIDVSPEGLFLTAPYHKGLCVRTKDNVHSLSLLLTDVELSVKCPSLPDNKTATATFRDSAQHPHLLLPQYQASPGSLPPTRSPGVPSDALPKMFRHPQLHTALYPGQNPELHRLPSLHYPAYTSEISPQYFWFRRPVLPTHAPDNTRPYAAFVHPHYGFPYISQFPMAPWTYQSAPAPILPPTTTSPTVTTKVPSQHEEKPIISPKHQFHNHNLQSLWSFPLRLPDGRIQTIHGLKNPLPQFLAPHVYPRPDQIPVMYPPGKYFSRQQKPLYYPHPYLPVYFAPPMTASHGFSNPPANHPS
ncbi:uncharacterized protein LOC133508077 isoform X2 [Syngnathoides biaculeatus]|uniref:uncharacterized protein LOC133508077 isoform X2 n=1 Tax=Syngnathoides biaculeatus TaxID=300417 RepID=UPI002ADE3DD6|nr:uncharacterized protein LOC133508077 isoform X2 [Syngnathoides biaculeatus]